MPTNQPTVPREFAGKWIAWNREFTKIVASGDSLSDVLLLAKRGGTDDPILEKSPRANLRQLGGPRCRERIIE